MIISQSIISDIIKYYMPLRWKNLLRIKIGENIFGQE